MVRSTGTMEIERLAKPHLFATGKGNNDGFIVRSIIIQRDSRGERERAGKRERECSVLQSPCEESVISQAKCEWLTRLSEGGESTA